jgi:hypothetical protein
MRFGAIAAGRRQPQSVFERATGRRPLPADSYGILIFCPAFAYRTFMRRGLFKACGCVENEVSMLDVMFIAIGLGFLGGAMLYAAACDRL